MKYKLIYTFIVICLIASLVIQTNKVYNYSSALGTEVSIIFSETYYLYHEVLVSYKDGTIDSLDDSEVVRMLSVFEDSTVLHNHFDMYRIQLMNSTIIELIESVDIEEQKELYQLAIELEEETSGLISYAFELSGGEKGIDPDGIEQVLHPTDISRFASLCNENSSNYRKFKSMIDDIFNRQYSKLKLITDKYKN